MPAVRLSLSTPVMRGDLHDPVAETDASRSPSRNSHPPSAPLSRFLADRRGAIATEYVVLVGTIGLAVVFALITVGPKLVKDFTRSRDITASPFP